MYVPPSGLADQPQTVASVRACLARFSLVTVAPRDLLGFGQSALAAEQPGLADSAFTRLESQVARAPDSARAWTLYQISLAYLQAAQPKLERARNYLARLDAMGANAAHARILAHTAMARVARIRDSVSLQARAVEAALAASRALQGTARKAYAPDVAEVYVALAELEARRNDGPAAVAALAAGRTALLGDRPSVRRTLDGMLPFVDRLGQPAPQIQATSWFRPDGTSDTTRIHRPATGTPSLVIMSAARCRVCYPGYAVLRRLMAKYSARGLAVILVTRTAGTFGGQLVSLDTEKTYIQRYFYKEIQLPVTLAIWYTEFSRRDDQKLIITSAPNDRNYPAVASMATYVIDAHGKIRLVSWLAPENEAVLDHVIASLW
jgi:hypothetical protein